MFRRRGRKVGERDPKQGGREEGGREEGEREEGGREEGGGSRWHTYDSTYYST